jgi:RNA polymerase sigma-70 factor (ECF subfamily)
MSEDHDSLSLLIVAIAEGDDTAMTAFYDSTVNRVFGMALKIVLRPELAEEVVGDVYLQVWRKAKNYHAEKAVPIAWLLMMCRSRALDRLRREKSATMNQYQQDEPREFSDESIEMPFEDRMGEEMKSKLTAALLLLNKKQRQTVALAFYRGMSHQEIAEYTAQPLGTVKSNIRRAQAILRNALDSEGLTTGALYGQA